MPLLVDRDDTRAHVTCNLLWCGLLQMLVVTWLEVYLFLGNQSCFYPTLLLNWLAILKEARNWLVSCPGSQQIEIIVAAVPPWSRRVLLLLHSIPVCILDWAVRVPTSKTAAVLRNSVL